MNKLENTGSVDATVDQIRQMKGELVKIAHKGSEEEVKEIFDLLAGTASMVSWNGNISYDLCLCGHAITHAAMVGKYLSNHHEKGEGEKE